jgi:hypothetical protein
VIEFAVHRVADSQISIVITDADEPVAVVIDVRDLREICAAVNKFIADNKLAL